MHIRQLLLALITLCLPATQLPKRVGAALSSNNTDTAHQPAADWKANAMRRLKNTPLPTRYQSAAALAVAAAVAVVYIFQRELLRVSAGRGYLLPVKLLITCGVDVNAYSKFGHSALFLAAENGHAAVVAYLLTIKNVKKNGFWDEGKRCFCKAPLLIACENGHLPVIKLLVTSGVDVNSYPKKSKKDFGKSALFQAAKNGHAAVVAYLLGIKNVKKNGFWDEETKTVYCRPLLEACGYAHFRVIELLLQDKAVNKIPLVLDENLLYYTPLMLCCLYANKERSFKRLGLLFIQYMTEEEINYFTKEGKKTALDYAIENGDKDILNALNEKNAKKYAELHI